MTRSEIQEVIDEDAQPGDVVYFNAAPEATPTQPEPYDLDARLSLKSGNSTSGDIIYTGDAATYNADGSVDDPGTVITKPGEEQHDHYAFQVASSPRSYVTIQNLTFDGCGIGFFDGSVDNLTITNNLVRNAIPDTLSGEATNTPEFTGAIKATTGLTNSTISNNVFKDNKITFGIYFDGGVYRNVDINNNVFTNSPRGIKVILRVETSPNNENITISGNKGIGLSEMLIEVQGGTDHQASVNGLVISGNKASGFVNHTDSTLAISVPIHGPNVLGMEVTDNEISDIPDQGSSAADGVPGVRIGLEVGGRTGTFGGNGVLIKDNKIYGVVTPISLTGGVKNAKIENSDKDIVWYTGDGTGGRNIDDYGVLTSFGETYNTDDAELAYENLPTDIEDTTVAFDAWVTGDSGADTIVVGSNGTITRNSNTVGSIPDTSNIAGLSPGRAVIDGKLGGDTFTVNGLKVNLANQQVLAALTVASGATVQVTPHKVAASPNGTVKVQSLSVSGVLDLTNNAMIIDYSGASVESAIFALLDSGHNGNGSWTGTGINSSTAAAVKADSGITFKTSLGFNVASELGVSTFAGMEVDGTSILIRYTYYGDATLDGQVNVADLGYLASNWQTFGYWRAGDFDYSGFVDVNDLGIIASYWQVGVENYQGPSFQEEWDELMS